jgi:multiple sugar transport system permease protein
MMQAPHVTETDRKGLPLAGRFRLSMKQKDNIFAWALVLPAYAALMLVIFWPILNGIWISFTDSTLRTRNNPQWNNFENYSELIQTGELLGYLSTTAVYVIAVVAIQFVLGLAIALLIGNDLPGKNVIRGLFMLPWTIPSVVVSLVWLLMLQPEFGLINYTLGSLGLIDPHTQWAQNPMLAMPAVILASVWRQFPIMLVMFIAGLQTIPQELVEAAKIDGAGTFAVFRRVTLPFLRPVIFINVLLAIIRNFQMFTIIYTMTSGGPLGRTTTLAIATHQEAFRRFDWGKGAAIGVVWLGILVVITLIFNWLERRSAID